MFSTRFSTSLWKTVEKQWKIREEMWERGFLREFFIFLRGTFSWEELFSWGELFSWENLLGKVLSNSLQNFLKAWSRAKPFSQLIIQKSGSRRSGPQLPLRSRMGVECLLILGRMFFLERNFFILRGTFWKKFLSNSLQKPFNSLVKG